MLSGLTSAGESMFPGMTMNPAPDPEEMEQEAQKALYNKTVKLKKVEVKTYDLSNTKSRNKYVKDVQAIFHGIQQKTHLILCRDRRFVEPKGGKPGWIVHMEWLEFELNIEANPVIPGHQGDTDGQA